MRFIRDITKFLPKGTGVENRRAAVTVIQDYDYRAVFNVLSLYLFQTRLKHNRPYCTKEELVLIFPNVCCPQLSSLKDLSLLDI